MNLDLNELFPELLSNKEFNTIAIFLEEISLEFRNKYSSKIERYYEELEEDMKESQEISARWNPSDDYPF